MKTILYVSATAAVCRCCWAPYPTHAYWCVCK